MDVENQFLFFFSIVGAFNAFIAGVYLLFFKRDALESNIFLAILLIALSVRVGNTMFYHFQFNPELSKIYLQIALSISLFIGPSIYLYVSSILNERKLRRWQYHFAPLMFVIVTLGIVAPFEENPVLWRKYLVRFIYYIWIIYIIFTGFLIKEVLKKSINAPSKISIKEKWILSVWVLSLLIWLAHRLVFYTSYILGGLVFSFAFYILLLVLIINWKKYKFLFINVVRYGNKKIDAQQADELLDRVKAIILEEKLYRDPSINLKSVAEKCNSTTHTLSQLLNDNHGKSFSVFINEFRINLSKEMLVSNSSYSIESIGFECGFNSRSNFFSNFKKMVGVTPSVYRKKHMKS